MYTIKKQKRGQAEEAGVLCTTVPAAPDATTRRSLNKMGVSTLVHLHARARACARVRQSFVVPALRVARRPMRLEAWGGRPVSAHPRALASLHLGPERHGLDDAKTHPKFRRANNYTGVPMILHTSCATPDASRGRRELEAGGCLGEAHTTMNGRRSMVTKGATPRDTGLGRLADSRGGWS